MDKSAQNFEDIVNVNKERKKIVKPAQNFEDIVNVNKERKRFDDQQLERRIYYVDQKILEIVNTLFYKNIIILMIFEQWTIHIYILYIHIYYFFSFLSNNK